MRRMIAGVFTLLLLAGTACSDNKDVPSGILPKEKMEKILWDMILADQYSSIYLAKDSARINLKMESLRLYEQVFRLHDISRDEFRKSWQYYVDRPGLAQPLFDSLIARGNRARTEGYSRPVPYRAPVITPPSPVVAPAKSSTPKVTPVKPASTTGAPGSSAKSPVSGARRADSSARRADSSVRRRDSSIKRRDSLPGSPPGKGKN